MSLRRHTLVLDSSGQLWAFGSGAKGQTGTGQTEDCLTPTLIKLPWATDSAADIPRSMCVCVSVALTQSVSSHHSHHQWDVNFHCMDLKRSFKDKCVFLFFFRREDLNWLECKLYLRFTCAGIMLNRLYAHTKHFSVFFLWAGGVGCCNSFLSFKSAVQGQITGRLDEEKLQKWLTMEHSNAEAKRSFSCSCFIMWL